MIQKKGFHILSILLISCTLYSKIQAQDTLTFMHYNILNYGNYASFCSEKTSPVGKKNQYISTILQYCKPDIVSCNEVSSEKRFQDSLKAVFQNNAPFLYQMAPITNLAESDLVNAFFYNTEKLILKSVKVIKDPIRDINVYTLYPKNSTQKDTFFFTCVSAHLKAGNSAEDANKRASMAKNIMNWLYLNNLKKNIFLMGDLNLYSSQEEAYRHFVFPDKDSLRFYDPIDVNGIWHDNAVFSGIHTQSTHLVNNEGCFATGGLDDRFDFILFNQEVKEHKMGLQYIQNSYQALGNNGSFFNAQIDYTYNMTVPKEVIDALFLNSDHLPVLLKVKIESNNKQYISNTDISTIRACQIEYPDNDNLILNINSYMNRTYLIQIYSITGGILFQETFTCYTGENRFTIPISHFSKGVYILCINDKNTNKKIKFIKV